MPISEGLRASLVNRKYIIHGLIVLIILSLIVWGWITFKWLKDTYANISLGTIEWKSMEPTLKEGDHVCYAPVKTKTVTRWDIVILGFKDLDQGIRQRVIKRVIAIPGDTVMIEGWTVIVWTERYTSPDASTTRILGLQLKNSNNILPYDNYLLLWDNLSESFDSRGFGLVSFEQIAWHVVTGFLCDIKAWTQ